MALRTVYAAKVAMRHTESGHTIYIFIYIYIDMYIERERERERETERERKSVS